MHAQQLIALMSKKGHNPQTHLLSLFDILNDAIQYPHIEPLLAEHIFDAALTKFCVQLSQEANAKHPKILADHILFIAQNAFTQQLNHPENKSLTHAKKVAQALILAQTQTQPHFLKPWMYLNAKSFAIGAGSVSALLLAGFLFWPYFFPQTQISTPITQNHAPIVMERNPESALTAQEASDMYAKYEAMRNGTCQFPEAIQIPDKDKAVYLESVVGGKLPTNLKDLATANTYLEKVRCNFTPMLMKKSK